MEAMVLSIYSIIKFSHHVKITTIDQLSFYHRYLIQSESNMPKVGNSTKDLSNFIILLYSSLIGTFTFPPPKFNIISHFRNEPLVMEVPFKTSYLSDPWNLPYLNDETSTSMAMPLSITEVAYKEIQEKNVEPESQPPHPKESDQYFEPIWVVINLTYTNLLDLTLPSSRSIMEAMNPTQKPCESTTNDHTFFLAKAV